jgi:hemolysin III
VERDAAESEHFDRGFVSRAIYGSISVLAVVLVMQEHPPGVARAAATLFGTSLAIALAEAYSETIAEMLAQRRNLDLREASEIWRSAQPILFAANIPTVLVLAAAAGLFSVDDALNVAEFAIYVSLFIWGARVGQLLHDSWWRILLSALVTVAIGLLIGLIKVVFH